MLGFSCFFFRFFFSCQHEKKLAWDIGLPCSTGRWFLNLPRAQIEQDGTGGTDEMMLEALIDTICYEKLADEKPMEKVAVIDS